MKPKPFKTAFLFITGFIFFIVSCNDDGGSMTARQVAVTKDSVQRLTESIAADVSSDGPVAWLHFFEDTSSFYMSAGGRLAFPNPDSAKSYVNNVLVKMIRSIRLTWRDPRIDVLDPQFASIGAYYHEDLTDTSGKSFSFDGYFSAVAHQTPAGWKLRNLHWSTVMDTTK